jgi:myo-inositol 2-dehydrogenase / D-chiro-inositol 1-dehydrogenase
MIGIALMGAGRMARVHAKAIGAAGGRLVTVYDVVEQAAKSLAADAGASVAHSPEEAFDRPDVDAVLIATSSNTHVDLIIRGVQAGKAVMCEKPLAPNLSDAQQCIDTLGPKANGVFLAFNRRFDLGHAELKKAIDRGEIGDLEQLTVTSRDPAPPPLDYIPNSGGLFRDMMIHDFDMARWILGEEPVTIYSCGSCLVDPEIGKLGDHRHGLRDHGHAKRQAGYDPQFASGRFWIRSKDRSLRLDWDGYFGQSEGDRSKAICKRELRGAGSNFRVLHGSLR